MDKKETEISEWINRDSFNYPYKCKKCGGWTKEKFNYCPHCGRKMKVS